MNNQLNSYFPQLDVLRACAALSIVILHWSINSKIDFGFLHYGVQLFFVISGFLITNVLLHEKERNSNKTSAIKIFFIRRVLRLVPIYYLFLLFLIIIKDAYVNNNILWFLFYLNNLKVFFENGIIDAWSNHTWSLSIEEQFYLLFPTIILFIKKNKAVFVPLIFILIGYTTKIIGYAYNISNIELFTLTQTDMLGCGILLAVIWRNYPELTRLNQSLISWLAGSLLLLSILLHYYGNSFTQILILPVTLMISFTLLVYKTYIGFTGWLGYLFSNKYLRYIGTISYGIYLYHKVIPLFLNRILNKLSIELNNPVYYYLINALILFVIAHFSWQFIELPILSIKKRFKY